MRNDVVTPVIPDGDSRSVRNPFSRPWRRACLWLIFLGAFFFASYGFANWAAGKHAALTSIVFDWERRIPFIPWTILPYCLIDLLYGLSLFVWATRRELDIHARRLLAAQLIAVTCFLLFPLRFAFERDASGTYGPVFEMLMAFDQPFNQAPSLHIALLVILWVGYRRILPRAWHWLLHAVFALIGISTLTTWQHHFFDVATGWWLGWFCVWLVPRDFRPPLARARLTSDPVRRRLALRYVQAALIAGILSVWAGGAWLWVLWISGALALVGVIYAVSDEAAFQKHADGSMSAASRWLLGPYLLGAWLNSRWWTRGLATADAVAPGVLLGRIPSRRERERLGVAAVVDVSAELPYRGGGCYFNEAMLDLVAPDVEQIDRASAAIEDARTAGPVLVCCALGYSRGALALAAWLVRARIAPSVEEAVEHVRRARPVIVLGPAHLAALKEWQHAHAARRS